MSSQRKSYTFDSTAISKRPNDNSSVLFFHCKQKFPFKILEWNNLNDPPCFVDFFQADIVILISISFNSSTNQRRFYHLIIVSRTQLNYASIKALKFAPSLTSFRPL